MTANRAGLEEVRAQIVKLSREEQLLLAEEIMRSIRKAHFTNAALDRDALEEMIADPDFQKVLNNQDLPYRGAELHEAG